jgi:hypothetical protein
MITAVTKVEAVSRHSRDDSIAAHPADLFRQWIGNIDTAVWPYGNGRRVHLGLRR